MHPEIANEGSVSSAADMRFARAAHTATRLGGGDVLVVGGFSEGEGDPLASAELYDATTDSFDPIEDVTTPRQSHTATLLPDGRVLITGGYGHDGPLRSAEIYDPSTRRFTPTGRMAARRAGHEAVRLEDGRVLVVGGIGPSFAFLESAEIYDPLTGRFSATGVMSAPPRVSHDDVAARWPGTGERRARRSRRRPPTLRLGGAVRPGVGALRPRRRDDHAPTQT